MWQFWVGLLCFPVAISVSDDNMSCFPEWFNFGMLVLRIVMGFYMIGYSMFSQRR
ncbi:hypothetical protein [Secundilactobacillus kimchicus]|uniref:hypothetical protein n=1 Tax=Secundilactobacillus kimchicus TaxID=528209 RepID=UPI000A4A99C5|nr:hypothetical protein [Secundilactobacillus kimchicus]